MNIPRTLNPDTNFFLIPYRMAKNRRTRKNTRKNKHTRKNRRHGGQRANASTCPPGQTGVNFKNWGGACGPTNSSYKLMMGVTSN